MIYSLIKHCYFHQTNNENLCEAKRFEKQIYLMRDCIQHLNKGTPAMESGSFKSQSHLIIKGRADRTETYRSHGNNNNNNNNQRQLLLICYRYAFALFICKMFHDGWANSHRMHANQTGPKRLAFCDTMSRSLLSDDIEPHFYFVTRGIQIAINTGPPILIVASCEWKKNPQCQFDKLIKQVTSSDFEGGDFECFCALITFLTYEGFITRWVHCSYLLLQAERNHPPVFVAKQCDQWAQTPNGMPLNYLIIFQIFGFQIDLQPDK